MSSRREWWLLCAILSALWLLGCPDDDDDTGDDDTGDDDTGDDDTQPMDGFVGGVQVNARTDVSGDDPGGNENHIARIWGFHDQPWPGEIFGLVWAPSDGASSWEVSDDGEDCGWLTFERATCDPNCEEMDEYCDPDDLVCKPYPSPAPAGILDLTGPSLALQWASVPYWSQEVPPGAIAPGDTIEFAASGDATPAFSVSSTAVEPLQHGLVCDPVELLKPGEDLQVTWTPADGARVRLEAIPWNHGGARDRIYCDTADTGSMTVPADIVDEFLQGSDEFHGLLILTRYRRSVAGLGNGHEVAIELASSWQCYRWF